MARSNVKLPKSPLLRLLVLATLLVLGYVGQGIVPDDSPQEPGTAAARANAGEATILEAFRAKRSDFFVEVGGDVKATLRDDNKGSRHQKFILRLASGHTVLVSHNIDLAPRIDALRRGDRVRVRGEYEWNEQGGVIHWTHHDPQGRRAGGWIDHEGRRYK